MAIDEQKLENIMITYCSTNQFFIEIFLEMKDDDSVFADLLALYNSEYRQTPDALKPSSLKDTFLSQP